MNQDEIKNAMNDTINQELTPPILPTLEELKTELKTFMGANKLKVLFRAPFLVQSGYSSWAVQFAYLLSEIPEIDLYLWSVPWGHCRSDVLDMEDTINNKCLKRIKELIQKPRLQQEPDIFYTMTTPAEFQRMCKINIGITAGVEADRITPKWIEKCNEMDLIYGISKFTARIIASTGYKQQNGQDLRVVKPIDILQPAVDIDIYKSDLPPLGIPGLYTNKNFLFVGRWLQGGLGNDRKNIGLTIRTFLETFLGVSDVGFILKTSHTHESIMDKYELKRKINDIRKSIPNPNNKQFPPIYILHGYLTNQEMAQLYNHPSVIAYLSAHHGEGWGMPITEAMACNVPVILTPWSGNTDYMTNFNTIAVSFDMGNVPGDAQWGEIFVDGMQWANPRMDNLSQILKWTVENPQQAKRIGLTGGEDIRKYHSLEIRQYHVYLLLLNILRAIKGKQSLPQINFEEI